MYKKFLQTLSLIGFFGLYLFNSVYPSVEFDENGPTTSIFDQDIPPSAPTSSAPPRSEIIREMQQPLIPTTAGERQVDFVDIVAVMRGTRSLMCGFCCCGWSNPVTIQQGDVEAASTWCCNGPVVRTAFDETAGARAVGYGFVVQGEGSVTSDFTALIRHDVNTLRVLIDLDKSVTKAQFKKEGSGLSLLVSELSTNPDRLPTLVELDISGTPLDCCGKTILDSDPFIQALDAHPELNIIINKKHAFVPGVPDQYRDRISKKDTWACYFGMVPRTLAAMLTCGFSCFIPGCIGEESACCL